MPEVRTLLAVKSSPYRLYGLHTFRAEKSRVVMLVESIKEVIYCVRNVHIYQAQRFLLGCEE